MSIAFSTVIAVDGVSWMLSSTKTEKIFAEEVELAIASHPAVADVLVTARPSDRWGNEVVAIVETLDGAEVSEDDLVEHAASSIARYKLPKAVLFRARIQRSPVGKADYRWAREQAALSAEADS